MNINIEITDEDGVVLFRANCLSIESAEMELARFDRSLVTV